MRDFVGSFHPSALAPMLRQSYAQELRAWTLIPIMLSAVQGGTIGVIVNKNFDGAPGVDAGALDTAVAAIFAAFALGNLTSFIWASVAHGRSKVRVITTLQVATALCVAAMALAPRSLVGLTMVTLLQVAAWICWSGVITLRASVWRANYPDASRASVAGRLATMQAILMAASSLTIGAAMDFDPRAFRFIFPALALVGLTGAWFYSGVRHRQRRRLARDEREGERHERPSLNPLRLIAVLRADALYRSYMICMTVFGFGNLMMVPVVTKVLKERLGLEYLESIAITTIAPLAVMPIGVPLWARLLDRMHVAHFRAIHSWSFVAASATMLLAAYLESALLFGVGGIALGIGFSGGVLAWNLGHQHFANAAQDGLYMGVHVTLTGMRGLVAPFLAIGLFRLLTLASADSALWPTLAVLLPDFVGRPSYLPDTLWPLVFAVSLLLNLVGAFGFRDLAHRVNAAKHDVRSTDGTEDVVPLRS